MGRVRGLGVKIDSNTKYMLSQWCKLLTLYVDGAII